MKELIKEASSIYFKKIILSFLKEEGIIYYKLLIWLFINKAIIIKYFYLLNNIFISFLSEAIILHLRAVIFAGPERCTWMVSEARNLARG